MSNQSNKQWSPRSWEPRMNYAQSMEMAFLISRFLREERQPSAR